MWSAVASTSTWRRSSDTGTAPTICEPSTNTIAPTSSRQRADRGDVGAMAGGRLHAAERHQARAGVDALLDVVRLEPAAAERDLADVVALALEQPPREVVRAVLPLPDDDVLAGGRGAELGRDQPGRRRHRRDQRHVRGVGAHETGRLRPGVVRGLLAAGEVQAVRDPVVDRFVVGPGQRVAGEPDGRGVEVAPVRGRGKQEPRFGDVRDGYVGLRIGHDVTVRVNLGHDALRPGGGVFAGTLPMVWLHSDEGSRGRLPRGRCRGHGHGFVDALIDHADVRVALVDRRDGVGGHWRHAYPFVRLHQSSTFYGVASRVLGGGRLQTTGQRRGCTSARTSRPSAPTTSRCWPTGWSARDASSSSPAATTWAVAPSSRASPVSASTCPTGAGSSTPATSRPTSRPRPRRSSGSPRARASSRSTTFPRGRGRPASTSSWARARPRPTPASGCWAVASTPTRSAGCDRATRGC